METGKRMHPMTVLVSFIRSLKDVFFIFLILFVINYSSDATWVKIGRILFLIYLIYKTFAVILTWLRTTYVLTDSSVEWKQGVFTRKQQHLPYYRVQNVQIETPFYLGMFSLTKLTLETGAENKEASFTFTVITKEEAERIEQILDDYKQQEVVQEKTTETRDIEVVTTDYKSNEKTIHFNPTKKDILKASVLSFSYLLLIPILVSFFNSIDDLYDFSNIAKEAYEFLVKSWVLLTTAIIAAICIMVVFGLIQTYLRYGRYEISSDNERIYIRKGVLNEHHFSIRKRNVQAVHIQQSLLKRMLQIAEVKLISTGGVDAEDEVNSLYPFLPISRAYTIIEELLPGYEVKPIMERLPKKSLITRLCRIPWFWLIATAIIMIFFPEWWAVSIILFILTCAARYLNFYFSGFLINGELLQMRTGGISLTTLITTREKIIEFNLMQNFITKPFDLASFEVTNRGKPIHVQSLEEIPMDMAKRAFVWYTDRNPEIEKGA